MPSYNSTDKKLHQLSQIIAKVNRSLVPKQADDSHTNLYFEPIEKRIYGRWFEHNDDRYIFALQLVEFSFLLLAEDKEIVKSFPIEGKTTSKIEKEIANGFEALGLSTKDLMGKLHFDIPSYPFANGIWEKPGSEELNTWAANRAIANQACALFLGIAQSESEIRIWPHHFDTGVYCKVKKGLGIGFGLAMEDEMAKDSYFYMSAYPEDYSIQYDDLPASSSWRWEVSDNWKGAVLPLKGLGGKSEKEKMVLLTNYVEASYNWMIKQ